MKKFPMILLISLLLLSVACTPTQENKLVKMSPDYVVANNLSAMVKNSKTIVIGTFDKHTHSFNADRNPNNPIKESEESFSETRVYPFQVDETIKGSISSSSIQVSIPFTREITGIKNEQGQDLRIKIPSIGHVQPVIGKKYILFLTKGNDIDNIKNIYHAPFTPYMIEVNNNNKVTLKKPVPHFEKSVTTQSKQQYQVSIEGVEITSDHISGKALDEIKEKITKEMEKDSES